MNKLLLFFIGFIVGSAGVAQCPQNIDFEDGTFNGWTCYTGNVTASGGQNIINLINSNGPVVGRHTMLSAIPGNGTDFYGDFPQNCPNGSGHSIRLGNTSGGAQAEGVSYTFTIPATANKFSLIYYYAVVFQDPGHPIAQQPRLEIDITNLTDNLPVTCSSFSFIASINLPGFFQSGHVNPPQTPVWCKDWSANSINLDGNAGKSIQLFFKTADCSLSAHFGYAYIDVNTECSSSFVGAAYCHDDTAINVRAPYGYQNYTWYDNSFSTVLGHQQILHLSPPPASGSTVAVELTPYNGYGCQDTLYAQLLDTLTIHANAGADKLACNNNPAQLGGPPVDGLVYRWNPTQGLDNPNISNPIATPTISTTYYLSVTSASGGCLDVDSVRVNTGIINDTMILTGSNSYCTGLGNSVLTVQPCDSIQWFKDNIAIAGAQLTQLNVMQTGTYFAILYSHTGCNTSTNSIHIDVFPSPVAKFGVNIPAECIPNNQFIFTNSSTISSGSLNYSWNLGDGSNATTTDITHSYLQPGSYTVRLHVDAAGGCISDTSMIVQVYPTPVADFTIQPVCVRLIVPLLNNTLNNTSSTLSYLWDLGNGQNSTIKNPVISYLAGGTYNVKLSVSSAQCPASVSTIQHTVIIDAPAPNISYPVVTAVMGFPLTLHARMIGNSVSWNPGTELDSKNTYTPVFKGFDQQQYQIVLKTPNGCITVDTQLVKTLKRIAIYVPTGFSPNGDGINDFLKPTLEGIKIVNYFRVYNRWGQQVFFMNSDRPGWDGRINGLPQDSQVFVWMIEAVDVDGKIHNEQGTTLLIR